MNNLKMRCVTTNDVGTRASSAMRAWWIRQEVDSPRQACAYIQGTNQAVQPNEVYGEPTAQAIEDLIEAGDGR